MRVIRRLLFLALLGAGIGLAALRVASFRAGHGLRRAADPTGPGPSPDGVRSPVGHAPVLPTATWVEPVDGDCPPGFPVKVKVSSGIFHVQGGRFYERTSPDRCYTTPAAAGADGYRPAKA